MAFQITGKIEIIGDTVCIQSKNGGQPFYRRELVLDCTRYNPDTGEPWENHPKFEFSGQKCPLLDPFSVGQRVTVDFSLKGTKYADQSTGEIKYFTTISAFKIVDAGQQSYQGQPAQQQSQQASNPFPASAPTGQQPFPPAVDQNGNPIGDADDLPF